MTQHIILNAARRYEQELNWQIQIKQAYVSVSLIAIASFSCQGEKA